MALRLGTAFMQAHGVHTLPEKYAPVQAAAIDHANRALGMNLRPADVFLLATMPRPENPSALEDFLTRGSADEQAVRVCLTPTMAAMIDDASTPSTTQRPRPAKNPAPHR